jgi:hypothetical protein
MNSIKYARLGSDAIAYMRECLAQGHTLAKSLLVMPDLEYGTILAPVPPNTKEDSIGNYRHGPLLPEPAINDHVQYSSEQGGETRIVLAPNTNYVLEQIIRNYFKQNKHAVCIFEDALARASDPYLKSLRIKRLTHKEEVYYVLLSSDRSTDAVRRAIYQAANPHPGLICVVTTIMDVDFSLRRGQITKDGLTKIAHKAVKIILGAYHGEGYLIWEKPQACENE